LWLTKVWFSASTFVVKNATFAKPENVIWDFENTKQTNPKEKSIKFNVAL
jgi:hypothetical protein